MCVFLRENAILCDIKKTALFPEGAKKAKLLRIKPSPWGRLSSTLKGGSNPCKTHTPVSTRRRAIYDGASELTEREQWVMANFGFLKTVVHHAEPVNGV